MASSRCRGLWEGTRSGWQAQPVPRVVSAGEKSKRFDRNMRTPAWLRYGRNTKPPDATIFASVSFSGGSLTGSKAGAGGDNSVAAAEDGPLLPRARLSSSEPIRMMSNAHRVASRMSSCCSSTMVGVGDERRDQRGWAGEAVLLGNVAHTSPAVCCGDGRGLSQMVRLKEGTDSWDIPVAVELQPGTGACTMVLVLRSNTVGVSYLGVITCDGISDSDYSGYWTATRTEWAQGVKDQTDPCSGAAPRKDAVTSLEQDWAEWLHWRCH